jgi:hypothetical protein
MSSWGFSEIPHAIPGNKTTCMAPRLNYDCFVAPLLIHGEPSRGQPGGRCARDGYRAGEPLGGCDPGVFVWHEFRGAPRHRLSLLALMFFCM